MTKKNCGGDFGTFEISYFQNRNSQSVIYANISKLKKNLKSETHLVPSISDKEY
jgi:hypothetical protein